MAQVAGRYTSLAMLLHWLVALLIGVNLVLVWTVEQVPDSYVRQFIDAHKSIGITVLGLAVMRLLWRAANPPPPLPADMPRLERRGADVAHVLLYVLIFCLPLTGWMHDSAWKDGPTHPMTLFGLIPWPRIATIATLGPVAKERFHDALFQVHGWLAIALYALFALHVLGALKHQFLDRQKELQRMWPGRSKIM